MKKTVLITGATSGIGLGCARKFAANGDRLILTGRNEQRLEEIRKELTAKGTEVLTLVFDVRDREKATECINNLPAEWKDIDVLVNNAGLALGLEPEYEGSYDDWDTMVDTNIKGLLTMTRLVILMAQRGKEEPVPQLSALIKESQGKNSGCIHSLSCDSHPHPLDL